MRRTLAAGADRRVLEGYDVFIWPRGDVFYRSLALPSSSLALKRSAIDGLIANFRQLGREPRVEFFAQTWPELPAELEHAGWHTDAALPAMSFDQIVPAPPLPGIRELDAQTSKTHLAGFLKGLANTFGNEAEITPTELEQFMSSITRGAVQAAILERKGHVVAGGALTLCGDTAELQGVWVASEWRRRGIASGLCQHLLQHYLSTPDRLVWLSAGTPQSQKLYARIGCEPMGTQLSMCLKSAAE